MLEKYASNVTYFLYVLPLLILLASCSTKSGNLVSTPWAQSVVNNHFDAQIRPDCADTREGFKCFFLTVRNKSNRSIAIVWDRTQYIHRGRLDGGFVKKLPPYQQHETTLLQGGRIQCKIWPEKLYRYTAEGAGNWQHHAMKPGEHGVFLSIKVDESEIIREWLSLSFLKE